MLLRIGRGVFSIPGMWENYSNSDRLPFLLVSRETFQVHTTVDLRLFIDFNTMALTAYMDEDLKAHVLEAGSDWKEAREIYDLLHQCHTSLVKIFSFSPGSNVPNNLTGD